MTSILVDQGLAGKRMSGQASSWFKFLGIEIVDFIDMIHRRACPGSSSLEETGNPSHHCARRKIDTHVPMTTLKYQYL